MVDKSVLEKHKLVLSEIINSMESLGDLCELQLVSDQSFKLRREKLEVLEKIGGGCPRFGGCSFDE